MKCPNCKNEMVQSRAGWLCLSCGHVEAAPVSTEPMPVIDKGTHNSGFSSVAATPKKPKFPKLEIPEKIDKTPELADIKADHEPPPPPPSQAPPWAEQDKSDEASVPVSESASVSPVDAATTPSEALEAKDEKPVPSAPPESTDSHEPQAKSEPETPPEADPEPKASPAADAKPSIKLHVKVRPRVADAAASPEPPAAPKPESEPQAADSAPADAAIKSIGGSIEAPNEPDEAAQPDLPSKPAEAADAEPQSPPQSQSEPLAEQPDKSEPEAEPAPAPSPDPSLDPKPTTDADSEASASVDDNTTPPPAEDAPTEVPTPEPDAAPATPPAPETPATTEPPADEQPPTTAPMPPDQTPDTTLVNPDPQTSKPPFTPTTHAKPVKPVTAAGIIALIGVTGIISAGIYLSHPTSKTVAATLNSSASAASRADPDATPLNPTSTPSAMPRPATPLVNGDAQRKADLASYLAAYKAIAATTNGFFPVSPPTVSVQATDPGTGQAYVVSTAKAATVGQIQYWPGGSCTSQAITPGATGTRHLALVTELQSGATYCLDAR